MRPLPRTAGLVLWLGLVLSVFGACSDYLGPTPGEVTAEKSTSQESTSDAGQPKPSPDAGQSDSGEPKDSSQPSGHVPYEQTWYGGGVMYQLFPRSFADTDGDGVGDLKGIASRLDYLNTGRSDSTEDLKVTGIWLTPIFKSGSYHGYDTVDYMSLDPTYGSLNDFQTLLEAAHKRGLRVILDLVINHSSRNHPWFQDASKGPTASKRDWYVWRDVDPGWKHPFSTHGNPWHALGNVFFYAVFSPSMPDLNLRHSAVKSELKKIMKYWLEQGVDGFRLDAIRYLVATGPDKQVDTDETHQVLKELVASARQVKQDVLFVGEAWTTTQEVARYFGHGDEMDLCFQFDLVDAADRAFERGRISGLTQALHVMLTTYKDTGFNAPILGNHDLKRLMSRLGRSQNAAKLAASLLLTLPGTPFIYYGDEIGLGNSSAEGDLSKRSPMQWDTSAKAGFTKGIAWTRLAGKQETVSVAAQTQDKDSLLSHYRKMIRLRNTNKALRYGTMTLLQVEAEPSGSVLAFLRSFRDNHVVVVLNFSETQKVQASIMLDATLQQRALKGWKAVLSDKIEKPTQGTKPGEIVLPELSGQGALMYQLP